MCKLNNIPEIVEEKRPFLRGFPTYLIRAGTYLFSFLRFFWGFPTYVHPVFLRILFPPSVCFDSEENPILRKGYFLRFLDCGRTFGTFFEEIISPYLFLSATVSFFYPANPNQNAFLPANRFYYIWWYLMVRACLTSNLSCHMPTTTIKNVTTVLLYPWLRWKDRRTKCSTQTSAELTAWQQTRQSPLAWRSI